MPQWMWQPLLEIGEEDDCLCGRFRLRLVGRPKRPPEKRTSRPTPVGLIEAQRADVERVAALASLTVSAYLREVNGEAIERGFAEALATERHQFRMRERARIKP